MLALSGTLFGAGGARAAQVDVNEQQVQVWNRFSETLLKLHLQQLSGREIRKSEHSGRYGGEVAKNYSYKDIEYHDAKTGRLLSRVRWDGDKPEVYHTVEVFVYDGAGQLVRDFATMYLPWARNAPIRTFINLHRHTDGLHAYRQFDASGIRLYEQCKGAFSGKAVDISLEFQDIDAQATAAPAYKACFGKLPETAGAFLTPH
ncbi:MAG: hypothetical protein HY942_06115 [Gammaproteobacteria bacterium]|nr:hypothetical protein [Gammaproteobacteria bacterium]